MRIRRRPDLQALIPKPCSGSGVVWAYPFEGPIEINHFAVEKLGQAPGFLIEGRHGGWGFAGRIQLRSRLWLCCLDGRLALDWALDWSLGWSLNGALDWASSRLGRSGGGGWRR